MGRVTVTQLTMTTLQYIAIQYMNEKSNLQHVRKPFVRTAFVYFAEASL